MRLQNLKSLWRHAGGNFLQKVSPCNPLQKLLIIATPLPADGLAQIRINGCSTPTELASAFALEWGGTQMPGVFGGGVRGIGVKIRLIDF